MRWLIRRFAQHQWARLKLGGKWEKHQEGWVEVLDWSSPRTHPDLYGAGSIPEREEWDD